MTIAPGTKLGPYEVTGAIGAGGMGEVYRATDTKLKREVAIKVLPAAFVEDKERLARFEREAQLLAQLHHPHIASIFGLEESGESPALVMELVEGPTLAERLAGGPIPVDEALPIARQIAEALEYAHEHGIIHRDLKPANIKLTNLGGVDQVKILDFGLAKALDPTHEASGSVDLSHSPTMTMGATVQGMILGTAGYMSPEQARGRTADKRSDIWAFGCVVFEMLGGRRAFPGETVSDTLASVLKLDPDWDALPAATGPRLRRILARCLDKDPQHRFHSAIDAAMELAAATARDEEGSSLAVTDEGRRRGWLPWSVAACCAILGIAGVLLVWPLALRKSVPAPLTRFNLEVPSGQQLALPDSPTLAISADGRRVAVLLRDDKTGEDHLYLRDLSQPDMHQIKGTEGATSPFFSPDGKEIGFFVGGKLDRVSIQGGTPIQLANAPQSRGAVWLSDGSIIYSPAYSTGLERISANGGAPKLVVKPDPKKNERTYRWPDLLPGDRAVIYTVGWQDSPQSYVNANIDVVDLATGKTKTLIKGGTFARFVPPDQLIYLRNESPVAVTFDPKTLSVTSEPRPVLHGVGGDPTSGVAYLAVSRNGTLVWVAGKMALRDTALTMLDRSGKETPLDLPPKGYNRPVFSPDGRYLAFNIGQGQSGRSDGDIWLLNLATKDLSRLTFDGTDISPVFSPDGSQVAYEAGSGAQAGLFRKPSNGSGQAVEIGQRSPQPRILSSWSPDGRLLAYVSVSRNIDVHLIDVATGKDRLFASGAASAVFSPDNKYLAYESFSDFNIYVRPVEGEGKWQISPDGNSSYPRWSADGREIFYTHNAQLMHVFVSTHPTFHAGSPQVLFGDLHRYYYNTSPQTNYDVSPDGKHFVFVKYNERRQEGKVSVALNWGRTLQSGSSERRGP